MDITLKPENDIWIDEDAEIARPKPLPLREPRLQSPVEEIEDIDDDRPQTPISYQSKSTEDDESQLTRKSSMRSTKKKHESFDLAGSVFLITGDGKTLKLPIPSESKLDPLNWNKWKRAGAYLAVFWFSAVTLTAAQAMSLMLNGVINDFTEDQMKPWTPETLVTAPTLFMGIGCFIWVPLSLALGRRPVFLIVSLIILAAIIGAAASTTYRELLFFMSFIGLGEGFSLSLAMLMVFDLTFIDQRPKAITGLWSVAGFFGSGALSLVPYLSDHGVHWHTFFRAWIVPAAVSFLLAFFFYPETYFKRPVVAFDGLILLQSATETLTIYKDLEADSELYKDLPSLPFDVGARHLLYRFGFARAPATSWKAMGRCYLQILFCAINPMIFWVFIAVAFNFAGMMYIGATYNMVLSSPPYNLPSSLVIIVNLSAAIGGLVAYPVVSFTLHKMLIRLSKRNRGIREAEHYLFAYILPIITGALSTLLYGMAVDHQWHFSVYYLAYGLNGLSYVTLAVANTMWVTESFPRWAAPALVVVGGGGYLLSFTMSFGLSHWIDAHGFKLVGIELAVLQIFGGLIAVPIAFWGKDLRQKIHGKWANERSGALRPL